MSDPLKDLRRIADEVAREQLPTKACGTCRHAVKDERCSALGLYQSVARAHATACGQVGLFWEPRGARQLGIFERIWRFLFGGRDA